MKVYHTFCEIFILGLIYVYNVIIQISRILWKKNEVADYEATTFSIFYNNALFLAFVIVSSFYVLKTFTPAVNYILSVGATSAFLALFSTGSQ